MHSMNSTRAAQPEGQGHLSPASPSRPAWKWPQHLGRAGQFLAQEQAVSQGCSPGKGRPCSSLLSLLPPEQTLGSFSLWPEKSQHSKLLQNPSKSASSYLCCWLAVLAHHSKLEFNNLGVEQMAFPSCFYPECYQRETDNTISGIQSCTWKW